MTATMSSALENIVDLKVRVALNVRDNSAYPSILRLSRSEQPERDFCSKSMV